MEREAFRQRMQQYKQARESNPYEILGLEEVCRWWYHR